MVTDENLIHMNTLMQELHERSLRLYKISDPIHQDIMRMEVAFYTELEHVKKLYDALRTRVVGQQLIDIANKIENDDPLKEEKESIKNFKNNFEEVVMKILKEKEC